MATQKIRIKQYPDSLKGPYIVYVRRKEVDLDQFHLQKQVFDRYKSCSLAISINEFKMKFEFSELSDANNIVKDERMKAYRVYVPAKEVEVRGVISLSNEIDASELLNSAVGKFNNPNIGHVKILEVYRFNQLGTKTPTNKVKLTFEGTVAPDHIIVDRHLQIRVQKFLPKSFFCEKCLSFNHSTAYCTKVNQRCRKCGNFHGTNDCTSSIIKCIHCKGNHLAGDPTCPTKKQADKKLQTNEHMIQKNRYYQLQTLIEDDTEEETTQTENNNKTFEITQTKKRRTTKSPDHITTYGTKSYAEVASQLNDQEDPSTSHSRPHKTHRKRQSNDLENNSKTYKFVNEIVNKLDISLVFKKILIELLPPLLDSLWSQLSDSLISNLSKNFE